jgi:hypothetical protein
MNITVQISRDLLTALREEADRQFRTPEQQAAWIVRRYLERKPERTAEERLRAAEPLFEELDRLRDKAGSPSLRKIAADGGLSPSGIHAILTRKVVPTPRILDKLVYALGGDVQAMRDLYAVVA